MRTSRLFGLFLIIVVLMSAASGAMIVWAAELTRNPANSQVFGHTHAVTRVDAMNASTSDPMLANSEEAANLIVVQGEVGRIASALEANLIVSYASISVSRVVVGPESLVGVEILVRYLGGEWDGVMVWVSDQPNLVVGEIVELGVFHEEDYYVAVWGKTLAAPSNFIATEAGYKLQWCKPPVCQVSTTRPAPDWYGPARWASGGFDYWTNANYIPADLSPSSFVTHLAASFQTWEDDPNSLVDFTYRGTTDASPGQPTEGDGINAIGWGPIGTAISRTTIWYTHSPGDYDSLRIIETDILFDNTRSWSAQASGVPGRYDVQNTGTHESGHTFGLGDLYDPVDSEQTMYGYADTGETKKRTLELGDLAGIRTLYPATTIRFANYPDMFVLGGMMSGTVVVGASNNHSPCAAAHTIDVVGTNLIVASLGHYADTGGMDAILDYWGAHWTGSAIVLDVAGNIMTAGGPSVNYVWKYYNDLGILPAYFIYVEEVVYVPSTGHRYYMVNDYFQGNLVTDYAIIELYADGSRNVILVAGISGFATYYASKWLYERTLDGTIRDYDARAIILKLVDADGNPESSPPTITVQEQV